MKRTLRGIGIGIFLTGAFWTTYDLYFAPSPKEQITLLKQQLEDSEKKVQHLQQTAKAGDETEKDISAVAAQEAPEASNSDAATKKEDTSSQETDKDKQKQSSAQADIVTGTIMIYENVSLYDIGKQVEDAGIIENGRELELYLYRPEYARSIQIGQFELSSNMSLHDMAEILTGKQ